MNQYVINTVFYEKQDDYLANVQSILIGLEQNNLMNELLNDFSHYILDLSRDKFIMQRYPQIIIKTNKIKVISQSMSLRNDQQYKLQLTNTQLKSDNPDLILPYSNDNGEIPKFKPSSILLIYSQNNYLCIDSKSPEKCFQNIELTQILYDQGKLYGEDRIFAKNTEFSLFFDNLDNKLIHQYVCLTTNDGIMYKSLKIEISSNPPSVKCTFKNNVSLFQDLNNLFINQTCPNNKPIFDPARNVCVSKIEECSILSEDGKYCVAKCSNDQPFIIKLSEKQSGCQKSCNNNQIINEQSKQCYNDKKECKSFLIDGKNCSQECPKQNFQYNQYEGVLYTQCNSKCDLFSYSQDDQNICDYYCLSHHITDIDAKKCYDDKNECKNFLIDGKICSQECPKQNFQYKNESIPYKLCTSNCEFMTIKAGDKKYCHLECKKEEIFATVDSLDNPLQKYCNGCPSQSPFTKNFPEKFTACYSKCQDSEITDEDLKKCFTDKGECNNFLVDEKICTKVCKKDMFIHNILKFPFMICTSKCDLFTYTKNDLIICDASCLSHHIVNKEDKKCYNQKAECQKFVSYNGIECNSKCGEAEDFQQIEYIGNYKQCKICRNIIQEEQDSNKNKIFKCITQCNQKEMIYIFYNSQKNLLKKCVTKNFCANQMISVDKLSCSEKYIKPEINHGNSCVLQCPNNFFYSTMDNSCTDQCGGYYSSDGLVCVSSCEKIFETVDESIKDQKKCKKCSNNEYLSVDDSNENLKSECLKIQKTEETRQAMLKNLINLFQQDKESLHEVDAAQKAISSYVTEVGNKLKDIHQEGKTQKDQTAARVEFQNILSVTQQFLSKVDTLLSQKPVSFGNSEIMIKSQVKQPGKKFKISFNSNEIQQGTSDSMLEEDLDEASTKFDPYILQVSYLKNNHICQIRDCRSPQHLFIVTYFNEEKKRVLADVKSQQFQIIYTIPEGQESSKQWCQSVDEYGYPEFSKGEIQGKKINCKFWYGSGLFYDKNCEIDKKSCNSALNEEENEQEKEDQNNSLSTGAIAGIAIGVVVLIGLAVIILYFIRKRKFMKVSSQKYVIQNQQENVLQIQDNKVIDTLNNFNTTPKSQK